MSNLPATPMLRRDSSCDAISPLPIPVLPFAHPVCYSAPQDCSAAPETGLVNCLFLTHLRTASKKNEVHKKKLSFSVKKNVWEANAACHQRAKLQWRTWHGMHRLQQASCHVEPVASRLLSDRNPEQVLHKQLPCAIVYTRGAQPFWAKGRSILF